MIVRKSIGSGISGAVRYAMGEGKRDPETGKIPELAPGETSRIAWFGGTGFGFPINTEERLDIARRVMEWSAQNQSSPTKKCRQDCLHLMLAWDKDENPDRAEMEAAAHSVLEHLGMGHARAVWVAHDDTEHPHLHLVISRIDPESGRAFRDSFDKRAMSAWALEWEKTHGGVRCDARLEREAAAAERDPEKALNALASARETFSERDLHQALKKAIPAKATRKSFIEQLRERHDIVALADPDTGKAGRFTTRQTLAAEEIAEQLGESRAADQAHRASGRSLNRVIDGLAGEGKALRDDQLKALVHASGPEGLAVISGKAGTGKSFTMKAIQDAYLGDGRSVTTLAPTNKVASNLKRDGLEASTLHSMLGRLDRGREAWDRNTVVMVDEAGMVSTRLMARLLSHADAAGAKVILVGDEKQLASLNRGGMFGFFGDRHGAVELNEITRQRTAEQRELAVRASQYDFDAALGALEAQGGLVVVPRESDRIARAAELWRDKTGQDPKRSLFVVAVSNADVDAANLAVRQVRRERGELGPDQVLATGSGAQAFAVGDRVLFSGSALDRKQREAGLANGNAATVKAIDGARLTVAIDGGKTLTFTVGADREKGEFDAVKLGYAGTIYKAQGATYDEAIVLDSQAMRASTAYVALTRHRNHVTVVTSAELARPRFEPWMAAEGGFEALSEIQQASAARSYEAWSKEGNPEAAERYDLAAYVAYVQAKEAERRAAEGPEGNGRTGHTGSIAQRWQRTEDRRAASRFEALNYRPARTEDLRPAAVRATVGVEAFEQGRPQAAPVARPDPWARRTPVRPGSAEEERARFAAAAAALREPAPRPPEQRDASGLSFWQRAGIEAAERWQELRGTVRGTWQQFIEDQRSGRRPDSPDMER